MIVAKPIMITAELERANIPPTVAEVWASGPEIEVIPLLFQPTSSDPSGWLSVQEAKASAKVTVDSGEPGGASAFSFACLFTNGAGAMPIWGFGCLYQGQCLGVIQLDQPMYLARKFVLSVRGQAQPVR